MWVPTAGQGQPWGRLPAACCAPGMSHSSRKERGGSGIPATHFIFMPQVSPALWTSVSRGAFPSAATPDIQVSGQAGYSTETKLVCLSLCLAHNPLGRETLIFITSALWISIHWLFQRISSLMQNKRQAVLREAKETFTKAHYCCSWLLTAVPTLQIQQRKCKQLLVQVAYLSNTR